MAQSKTAAADKARAVNFTPAQERCIRELRGRDGAKLVRIVNTVHLCYPGGTPLRSWRFSIGVVRSLENNGALHRSDIPPDLANVTEAWALVAE